MTCSLGDTSFPQVRHRHRHGTTTPAKGSSGSSPAARICATASTAEIGALGAQNRHSWPRRTPSSRGATSLPHVTHRHRHGSRAFGYGSRGSSPAARISATASDSERRGGTSSAYSLLFFDEDDRTSRRADVPRASSRVHLPVRSRSCREHRTAV